MSQEGGFEGDLAQALERALQEAQQECETIQSIPDEWKTVLWETLPKLVEAWAEYEATLAEMKIEQGETNVDSLKETILEDFTIFLSSVYGDLGESLAKLILLPVGVGAVALDRCTPRPSPSDLALAAGEAAKVRARAAISYAQAVVSRLLAEIDQALSQSDSGSDESGPEEEMVI